MFRKLILVLLISVGNNLLFSQKTTKIYHKGNSQLENKEFSNALKSYEKVIKKDPSFAPAYFQIAYTYHELDSFNLAILYYQKCNEMNYSINEVYLNLGICYSQINEIELAKKTLMEGVFHYKDDYRAYESLGYIYSDLEYTDSAIFYFGKAKKLNPNEKNLDYMLAYSYSDSKDPNKMLFHLEEHHKKTEPDLHSLRLRGYAKYLNKQYSSAYLDLEESLKLSDSKDTIDYYAHFYMGLVNWELNQFSEAIIEFDNGEKIKETDELFYLRGLAKCHLTDYQGGINDLKKAIKLKDNEIDFFSKLSYAYVDNEEIESGLNFFNECIKDKPKNALNYYAIAILQMEDDETENAFLEINKAISLDSLKGEFFCLRAMMREDLNTFSENMEEESSELIEEDIKKQVLKDYEIALNFCLDKKFVLENRANYYFYKEDYEEALKDLELIEGIDSSLTVFHFQLKGKIAAENKNYNLAIESLNKALELDAEDGETHYEIAKVYYKLKEMSKFCYHIKMAVELGQETSLVEKCN